MKRLPQYKTEVKEGMCVPVFTHSTECSDEEFERAVNLARACAPDKADGVENYLRYEQWLDKGESNEISSISAE